jgi:hypothetical protein
MTVRTSGVAGTTGAPRTRIAGVAWVARLPRSRHATGWAGSGVADAVTKNLGGTESATPLSAPYAALNFLYTRFAP